MGKTTVYKARPADIEGHIAYSEADNAVWRDLFARQLPNVEKYCASVYLDGLEKMDLPRDRVPQCDEISQVLRPLTGWEVAPVPAVIGFERFFTMLSEKQFPAASFIRSREDFDYIEEPDIFHEIFGHTPLLCNPQFARFSQEIGKVGLKTAPKDRKWLIRLYWFTIEFGLLRENGEVKALGSGLASSPTELVYGVTSDVPHRKPFDVIDIMRTSYRIDIQQPVYFVLEDIDELLQAANRDLLADVETARLAGVFAPAYPPKEKEKCA
jgi:phenylalanine-4-hydroxylase